LKRLFLIRRVWALLVVIQIICIFYFIRDTNQFGLYNPDAFSYHVQWSKVAYTLNPLSEAILADPDHDLIRIPFSFPHFLIGLTAAVSNPMFAYLFWCCVGVLMGYFSLLFFARALGFTGNGAVVVALVHYTCFHWLSQLPPLSGKQLSYILDAFKFSHEPIQHFGPRQYPHDIFFYPLLYTLLALTLLGFKKIMRGDAISLKQNLLWGGLCLLLPLNYFYHWFQFAFALVCVAGVGFVLRWWKWNSVWSNYKSTVFIFCLVMLGWGGLLLFQNSQLADEEGYRFALMGGLTEARFALLPVGLLIRIILWSLIMLIVLKWKPDSVLLVSFLTGCMVLMNMQLIVGKNIQPGHWSFGVDRVFAWIIILTAAWLVRTYAQRWSKQLIHTALVLVLILFGFQSYFSWRSFESLSHWDTERYEVIAFMKAQPAAVVLVPEIWLETDILIHTPHFSFIPRGAQSAVSVSEQLERLAHSGFVLGYSKEGFLKWLHIRSVRFFGMLYGTSKEFSSTLYFTPKFQPEVLEFNSGDLPEWDWDVIETYSNSDTSLSKKLDWVVLHHEEYQPLPNDEVVFENKKYIVIKAPRVVNKEWGVNMPGPERKYPLIESEQRF
jgi:hypothetical protein